eukprot:GHVS01021026.1.p1 GENE.GHVS01021026.1~~GHVS01021026.1.p1  ORF type:complete len:154 (+),score=37.76 GHVS01021026.1:163-624(+)
MVFLVEVGPEWGQQFVDNFFQAQPATQAGQPMYTSGEYVNTPTANYGGSPMQPMSAAGLQQQQVYYTAAAPPMAQQPTVYQQQPGYGSQAVSYSGGYYEPSRSIQQQAGYAVPQFQAPQYSSYAPQGGSQVYMMPPVVKKSSSSKKKKQGMCC